VTSKSLSVLFVTLSPVEGTAVAPMQVKGRGGGWWSWLVVSLATSLGEVDIDDSQ